MSVTGRQLVRLPARLNTRAAAITLADSASCVSEPQELTPTGLMRAN
jgi:hypothetical protein